MFPDMMTTPGMFQPGPPGPSMFQGLSQGAGPSPDAMEEERKRVLSRRHVEMKSHHVEIFDMHKAKDVKAYTELMQVLVPGTQALTHKVWVNERTLVHTAPGRQNWLCYLEWSVFELKEEVTAPVGTGRHGDTHA